MNQYCGATYTHAPTPTHTHTAEGHEKCILTSQDHFGSLSETVLGDHVVCEDATSDDAKATERAKSDISFETFNSV